MKIRIGDYVKYKCWWMQQPAYGRITQKGCRISGLWQNKAYVVKGGIGIDSIYPSEVIRVYKDRYKKP